MGLGPEGEHLSPSGSFLLKGKFKACIKTSNFHSDLCFSKRTYHPFIICSLKTQVLFSHHTSKKTETPMTQPGRDLTGKRGQAGARAQYHPCHMCAKGYSILGGEKGPAPSLAPQTERAHPEMGLSPLFQQQR